MKYPEVAEARDMGGLRLVLTAHVPGPWGESAKAILEYKAIPYAPVAQHAGGENADLVEWTGVRNAPIAVFEEEAPRTGWYDILMLAERLAPERPLLPERSEDRSLVVGICGEICNEWGFGWARRLMMSVRRAGGADVGSGPPPSNSLFGPAEAARMRKAYGRSVGGTEAAPERCADILRMLAARLHQQRADGSPYLVGPEISACDLYWAVFSLMLEPLPHELNPMPEWMRVAYGTIGPVVEAANDRILLEHRELIYQRHLRLPLDF